jgi:phosphatidate cytidylyltransferase
VSELAQRVAVAAIGIPLAVIVIWAGGWWMGIVLALLAAVGASEVCRFLAARGVRAFVPGSAALSAAFVVFAIEHPTFQEASPYQWAATIATILLASVVAIWRRGPNDSPLFATAGTVFGAVFVGGCLAFAVYIRHLASGAGDGPSWLGFTLLAYPMTLAWMGDTFAYFAGRAWGRKKLIPSVSPGKTVTGAVAGYTGTIVVGGLFGWLIFGLWQGLPMGFLAGAVGGLFIGPAAQLGDLAESLFKRDAGLKDSGELLPGHGGILDRFDAILFAVPVAYVYMVAILPLFIEGLPWSA